MLRLTTKQNVREDYIQVLLQNVIKCSEAEVIITNATITISLERSQLHKQS